MLKISNVLVATDFGEASIAALAYGREFARAFGARLHVLHVVENSLMVSGPDAVGIDVVRLQAELEAQAQAKLDTVVTAEDRDQLGTIAVVGIAQSPALEIVRYARAADIDLMIVGTHGRGFVAHLLMGNVAEKVVRLAPCPVLTVHHPEHDFIAPDALQAVARQ